MGKKPKQQKVPKIDPNAMIRQNELLNRVNVSTPFGSQVYGAGPDGRATLTTNLSPQMQALFDQQITRSQAPAAQYHLPEGQSALLQALMQRVQSRVAPPAPTLPTGG